MNYLKENSNSVEQYRQWLEDQKRAGVEDKIQIHTPKIADNKNYSFWYCGDIPIASIELNDGGSLSCYGMGDGCVKFEEGGEVFCTTDAIVEADRRGYGDNDIQNIFDLQEELFDWEDRNYFHYYRSNSDGKDIEQDFDNHYTYDDAIDALKRYKKEIDNGEL